MKIYEGRLTNQYCDVGDVGNTIERIAFDYASTSLLYALVQSDAGEWSIVVLDQKQSTGSKGDSLECKSKVLINANLVLGKIRLDLKGSLSITSVKHGLIITDRQRGLLHLLDTSDLTKLLQSPQLYTIFEFPPMKQNDICEVKE